MPTEAYKTCSFCEKEVEEEELENHQVICREEEVECGNDCGLKLPRQMLSEHVKESCRKRKVVCDLCKGDILYEDLEDHKVQCSQQVVECELNCGVQTERCNLSKHMAENCSKSQITCYYCGLEVKNNNIEDHAKKCDRSKCLCDKCGMKVQEEYMTYHLKERCMKRLIQCVFCDASIVVDLLPEHLETCEDVPVRCERKCGKKLPRKKIGEHLQECPKRMEECDYCEKEFESQLLEDHLADCVKFPIPCPESCGVEVAREEVERHLDEECQKRFAACAYKEMQCSYEGFPEGMKQHMKEEMQHHLELTKSVIDRLRFEVKSIHEKLESERKRNDELQMEMNVPRNGSFLWKVEDIVENIEKAKNNSYHSMFSPPFYSSKHGYKLRLEMDPYDNHPEHKGRLGVYIQVMPGEYDSILKWPFTKLVKFRLVDQATDGEDIVRCFRGYDNESFIKPKDGKCNTAEGYPSFVSHEVLNSRSYVVDNAIFLEVSVEK